MDGNELGEPGHGVGLIGLGAMGSHFGRRLLEAGWPLFIVMHRSPERAAHLVTLGATVCATPAELAERAGTLLTALPDVPDVEEVLFGSSGAARALRRGSLFVDLSTITPSAARLNHARLLELGVAALDAPVSGGPMRAADGTLTIMAGGEEAAYARALPLLRILGQHLVHVGPPGSGQALKLVNQLLISIIMVANAEALSLGVKAGLALETMLEVVGTSSGSNYLLSSWLPRTLFTGDLSQGFAVDLLVKDLRAALSWAREEGCPVFAGALAEQLYRLARTEAGGRDDYSVVARVYEAAAGIQLRRESS